MLMAVFCLGASLIGINAQEKDWANLQRYAQQNAELPKPDKNEKRVVFMGNSITEGWVNTHPDFFKSNGYIGPGHRRTDFLPVPGTFQEDVINLSPALVVINAATNDIAENTGAYHEDRTFGNIVSMVELAKANHIKVILTTTLPAAAFGWNPAIKDAPQKIASLNARLKAYAQTNKIPFVDYYSSMVSGSNKVSLNPAYTKDGVHPTSEGYDVMENLIQQAINKTLR